MDDVRSNVVKVFFLNIFYLSLYSLILEYYIVFMNKMCCGKLYLLIEDLEVEMFEYIIFEMERNGFEYYEIFNFIKLGFESCYNLMYWDNVEYYGVGVGVFGYFDGICYCNRGLI